MDTPKRKSKKRKPRKVKNNVVYIAKGTNDEAYSSPEALLEMTRDEYKTGERAQPRMLIILLEEDDEADIFYRTHGLEIKDLIMVAARMNELALSMYGAVDE